MIGNNSELLLLNRFNFALIPSWSETAKSTQWKKLLDRKLECAHFSTNKSFVKRTENNKTYFKKFVAYLIVVNLKNIIKNY